MPVEAITGAGTPPMQAVQPQAPVDDFATSGADWNVGGVPGIGPAGADQAQAPEQGFGGMLADSVKSLQATQDEAAGASQALATGQASDVSSVVMAVERAKLSMQLAAQIRTKAVEAYHEIFRTTV